MAAGFFDINLGNLITMSVAIVSVIIAYSKLKGEQNKAHADAIRAHDDSVREQAEMHKENQYKLDRLTEYHIAQQKVNEAQDRTNRLRDEQIRELKSQTEIFNMSLKHFTNALDKVEKAIERRMAPRERQQ